MAKSSRPACAFGYLRVSTDSQADSGLGLDAQRVAVEKTAARLGLPLAGVFTDEGLSGSLDLEDRPQLFAAVQGLKRGDVLIVAKRDRLGRDVVIVALIEKQIARKGARLVSSSGEGTELDGAGGMLQRGIVDLFSQYERAMIAQRTKAALQAKRARGERAGTIPFGYRLGPDGRSLVEHAGEREVLSILRQLHDHGFSAREVADELNRQGFRTRTGGLWQRQYILRHVA